MAKGVSLKVDDGDILSVYIQHDIVDIYTDGSNDMYSLTRRDVINLIKAMKISKGELIEAGIT